MYINMRIKYRTERNFTNLQCTHIINTTRRTVTNTHTIKCNHPYTMLPRRRSNNYTKAKYIYLYFLTSASNELLCSVSYWVFYFIYFNVGWFPNKSNNIYKVQILFIGWCKVIYFVLPNNNENITFLGYFEHNFILFVVGKE